MTYKPDIFIYHAPCDDGFGAAWAVWRKWGDGVQYIPAKYGDAPPDVTGKHVLIGDFSYKRPLLEAMSFQAASIVILDHHKTAEADLRGLPPLVRLTPEGALDCFAINAAQNTPAIAAHFDMTKSGARLVWEFCHPGQPMPELILYIEDRDLWRFTREGTKNISLLLRSYDFDFEQWDSLARLLENPTHRAALLAQATTLRRFYDRKVAEMLEQHKWTRIGEDYVPVVNTSWAFASDVAHALLLKFPASPFTATYFDRADGKRQFSLRSEDSRTDVSEVAKRYGGGGHRNAAGFEIPAPAVM